MDQALESVTLRRCRTFSAIASGLAVLAGIVVLIGWTFNLGFLTGIFPGFNTMKPNTALCFLLSGVALWLQLKGIGRSPSTARLTKLIVRFCAALVTTVGGISFCERIFHRSIGIDELMYYRTLMATHDPNPGLMATATALAFVFLGATLLLVDWENRPDHFPAQWLALATVLIGVIAILGYVYGVRVFSITVYATMALHTATLFTLLGAGMLCATPDRGLMATLTSPNLGGLIARRLLPVLLVVPVLVGWIRLQGQKAGYYDLEFGLAMFTASSLIISAIVVWTSANWLNRTDQARSRAEERDEQLAAIVDSSSDAIIGKSLDGTITSWNKGAERLYGYSTEEAIGQNIAMLVPPSGLDDITGFLEDLKRGFPIERFETVRRRKDKVLIHVSLTISPVYDREGRVVGASSMAQDITQRKLAEERLSQSRAQLKGIIDSAMDAVITVDENQRVVMFNTAAEAIFEYSADEIVGKHLERLIPQRLRTAHAGHIGEFSKTGTTSRAMGSLGALSGLRRDGTEFPIEASISQVKINGRKFFTAIVRDVTERQRTDKALREQTSVLELAQVLVRDMDDRIVLWNRGAEKLYGFTAEEAMGRLSHDLLRTEFPEPIEAIKKTLLREGEWEGELVHHKRDGSRIVVASVWVLERQNSGQPQRVLEANTDITERKRAEEATKLAQARLVSAMEGGGMGTWVWDIANGRIEWDESIHALLGRSQEELAGGSLEPFFSWIHPQDRDRTRAAIEDALREGVNYQLEYRVFRPDQSIIWITSRGRVERNERGEPFRITGVAIDITDRKKMEEQILQSQKMQSLGTLAGGIAHDFNNILLAIGGNASLAVEDLEPDHPAMTSLREISKASARAKNLVRQILTFSRRQAPARKPLAVRTVIEEALALLRATLPARIEITAKFDPDLPSISADSTQLHQVIMNLGTNAARAIGEGEGVLQVTAKALNVTPDFVGSNARLKEGRYVRLSISDNGCGMDSAILDRIFDPFFTTQDPGQGTGLGLSVVHGIMNDHEGSISVYSERGKGSTFRLYFPAVKEAGEKPVLPAKMPLGHGQRLLYVDDEEALVRLSQRSLGRLGYHVTGETNPSRAVQIFRETPLQFDAIITDLSMPGMSGSEVARQVLAIRPEIPVVMMSGFVRPEDEQEARRIGVRYVILKPDTIEELAQSLDQIFTVGSTSARTIGRLSRS